LPDLLRLGGRCLVACDPRLAPLFARAFPQAFVRGVARRLDRAPAAFTEPIDYQLPCGSLPLFFRSSLAQFPRQARFLFADPRRVARWRQRYAKLGPGLKVGISWKAGGQPISRRKRTTSLADWAEVLATPGVRFVSLQYGECADELAAAREELGVTIHDWQDADALVDLDGFAAKLRALDLVISVGNATVHLAGALGVPAWALVPRVPGWRWLNAGESSPWYGSVRVLRQKELGQWGPVFEEIARGLRQLGERSGDRSTASPGDRPTTKFKIHRERNEFRSTLAVQPGFEHLTDARERFDEARRKYEAGDLAAAEAICREIVEHAPRSHAALHLWGLIAQRTGRIDLAVRCLLRAVSACDADPRLQANLAAALDAAGNREEAIARYGLALEKQPNSVPLLKRMGMLLHERRRFDEALSCYQRALTLQPDLRGLRMHREAALRMAAARRAGGRSPADN
jgi:Flp pilus assembly protein TadD